MENKRIPLATPTMHGEEMGFVKEAFEKNWIGRLALIAITLKRSLRRISKGKKNITRSLCVQARRAYILLASLRA